MAERSRPGTHEVRLTRAAQRDVKAILNWSRREFGESAAERYKALIKQALRDIREDPERASKERPDILVAGVRTYHLASSRSRVGPPGVKEPRHFIIYRLRQDGAIEIGRILHDGRDLQRHLPDEYIPSM